MELKQASAAQPSPSSVFIAVGGLYVGQSIIGGLTFIGLPAVLRTAGLSLEQVGLLYLAIWPWALKFLWAPFIERYRLPREGKNRSRNIVAIGVALCSVGLSVVALIGPMPIGPVIAVLSLLAFVTATVDIACDGYAVETLAKKDHGWGNAAQVGGAYVGSAIGAGLFLLLTDHYGWMTATLALSIAIPALALPFILSASRYAKNETRDHLPSARSALMRKDVRIGLIVTAVYVAAQKWGVSMLGPFLVDYGFDLVTIGALNGLGSMVVGFGGALLGGALVRLYGPSRIILLSMGVQILFLGFFAFVSVNRDVSQVFVMGAAVACSSGVMSVGFVALYARFMGWSDPKQAGIDFTLFQCMDALISMVGGIGTSYVAATFGYRISFLMAAIISLVAASGIVLLMRNMPSHDAVRGTP